MDLTLSKEETAFCLKGLDGTVLARGKVAPAPDALLEASREHCLFPGRIVIETGTLLGWLTRALCELGMPVDVIDV